ncbi:MAG: aldehyde dehydrogenase family protein, partial [Pirellulales bacterium]
MPTTCAETLARLQAGTAAFAAVDARGRARLAADTARAVARAAPAWIDAAVTLKAGALGVPPAEVVAEETATGPLATLRLLLITARIFRDVASRGVPRAAAAPRELHPAGLAAASFIGVEVLPEPWIADRAMFSGHQATVRCGNPGGVEAFLRSWREECRDRPRRGGVALVLGAGNVTGLAAADSISQVFEHGRAALLKLHPLHEPLAPVLAAAFEPLVAAGMLAIVTGGPETAAEALASPLVTHVHLTGGQPAFDAIVWGGPGPRPASATPVLATPITCELGGVTPWIVVPGRYSAAELAYQADVVAASMLNNTSFNCIATKCVVTCRSWDQRDEFLALVAGRLAAARPRPAWYPGSVAAWEQVAGGPAPADGTLPWIFRTGLDPVADPRWLEREWFVPVAAEVPLDAADIEAFCVQAGGLVRRLPGSLAASVTVPGSLPDHDARRVDLLVDHLEYGVVAVNTWSALAYAFASVPW